MKKKQSEGLEPEIKKEAGSCLFALFAFICAIALFALVIGAAYFVEQFIKSL